MQESIDFDSVELNWLFNQIPDVYYVFNTKLGAQFWSDNIFQLLKFDSKKLKTDPLKWINAIYEDDREMVLNTLDRIKQGSSFDIEYRIYDDSGRLHWLRDRSVNIEKDGDAFVIKGFVTDITETKQREMEILKRNLMMEETENVAAIGSFEIDITNGSITVSNGWRKIHGTDQNNFSQDELMKFAHPDDVEKIENALENIERDGEYELYHRIVRENDAAIRSIHAKGKMIFDKISNSHKLFGSVIDVTEKLQVEKRIAETMNDLELAQEIARVGNWKFDPISDKPVWSDEIYRIYEREKSEGPPSVEEYQKMYDPVEYEKFKSAFQNALKTGSAYNIQLRLKVNNNIKYVRARCRPSQEKGENGYILYGTIQDITAEVAAFNELEAVKKNLEEINKDKNLLLSIVSHDLRGPFSSLIGLTGQLDKHYQDYSDQRKKRIIKSLRDQLEVTYSLIENLLTWASFQQGKIIFEPRNLNLKEQLQKVVDSYTHVAEEKSIEIKVVIPGNSEVFADMEMLAVVFRNLLSNAIKYTLKNGVINISASQKEINGNSFCEIIFTDNGIGIASERLPNIFSNTLNESTPGTSDEKGTGFGLMICKHFVEKNEGTIRVESTPKKGTSFIVDLPS